MTRGRAAWLVALAAAVATAAARAQPTGVAVIDLLLLAALGATIALTASWAARWTWLLLAGALVLASGWPVWVALAICGLVLAVLVVGPDRQRWLIGAVLGGMSIGAFMHSAVDRSPGPSAAMFLVAFVPPAISGICNAPAPARRRLIRATWSVGATFALGVVVFIVGMINPRAELERALDETQTSLDSMRGGDAEAASAHLNLSVDAYEAIDAGLERWWVQLGRVAPGVGRQLDTIRAVAREGRTVARAAIDVAEAGGTDVLQFERGGVDLEPFELIRQPLVELTATLARSSAAVEALDTTWLAPPLRDRVDALGEKLDRARSDADLAIDAVDTVPILLGGDTPKRYFVAFVTPVEARGRTGFMGSFGEIIADDGEIRLERYGRTGDIDRFGGSAGREARTLTGPADYLARYRRFRPEYNYRNVSMSPHFPSVAQVIEQLYPQSGGEPLDGVISIDAIGLAAMLRFTGPVAVDGLPGRLNAEEAEDFLLQGQYLEFEDDRAQRVDFLESAAEAAFERLDRLDITGPRQIKRVLGPVVEGEHLVAYSNNADAQAFLVRMGVSGRLPPIRGDYLAVVGNNAGGNKIDLFTRREIDYQVRYDQADRTVEATLRLTVHNDAPTSGLPAYIIGNNVAEEFGGGELAPGTNRTYLSIYSPLGLRAARLDGHSYRLETGSERGRNVYSTLIDIPPGGSATLELELSGSITGEGGYLLDIDPQPLVHPDALTLSITASGGRVSADESLSVEGRTGTASAVVDSKKTFRLDVSP